LDRTIDQTLRQPMFFDNYLPNVPNVITLS
jgi:hypothetical protein